MIPRPMAVLGIAAFCVWCADGAEPSATISQDLRSEVDARVAEAYPLLEPIYKHLHTHPELSGREEQTSQRVATELEKLAFQITRRLGGHGIVGVLSNGPGPTILVRTD